MKASHHNFILKAIKNKKNEAKHLESIRRMIDNFENMFGICRLSNNLFKEYHKLVNTLL